MAGDDFMLCMITVITISSTNGCPQICTGDDFEVMLNSTEGISPHAIEFKPISYG